MARFDPDIRPSSDPNYLGYSKEGDKPKPNQSLERLFSGMGDLVAGAVKTVDDRKIRQIKDELYTSVDTVRNEQGVEAAVSSPDPLNLDKAKTLTSTAGRPDDPTSTGNPGGGAGVNLPPGIASVGKDVERLKQAKEDGRLTDSYYYSRLEGVAKQLRARYPGYRDEIDGMMSKITGVNPANALRKAIQEDLDKRERELKAATTKDQAFLDQNAKYDQAGAKAVMNGKMTIGEFRQRVYTQQAEEHDVNAKRQELALANDLNAIHVQKAEGLLHQEFNNIVSSVFDQTMIEVGGSPQGFLKIIQESAKTGKPLTPEMQEKIRPLVGQLRAQIMNGFDRILNQELAPGSGKNYASIIKDKSKIDGIRDIQLARIDALEKQLTDGQFGLLNLNTNLITAMKTDTIRKLYDADQIWRIMAAAKEIGSDGLVNGVLTQTMAGGSPLDRITRSIVGLTVTDTATNGTALSKIIDDIDRTGTRSGSALNALFTAHSEALKAATKEGGKPLENLVEGIFKDSRYISRFDAQSRLKVFAQMASPEVTNGLKKNPALMEKYARWVSDALPRVLGVQGQRLQEGFDTDSVQITFENGQFKVAPVISASMRKQGIITPNELTFAPVQEAVTDINRGLALAKPVIEAQGGNFDEFVRTTLQKIGVSGIGPKPAEKGFFRKLLEGITGGDTDQSVQQPILEGTGKKQSLNETGSAFSNFIGQAEGADYSTLYGGWKGAQIDPTELTVAEVLEHQRMNRKAGAQSSAVGKGQFMPDTIRSLVADGVISLSDRMTPDVQEQMIEALIERRKKLAMGPDGTLDKEKFADELAKEWASLPNRAGKSHYEGLAGNKSTVSRKKLLAMLED